MCKHPEDLDLEGIDTVAIDIETYDPNLKTKGLGAIRKDGFITGVAVATGKDTVYFSIKHSDDNKSEEELKEFWDQLNNKLLQNPDITKVFHNAIYDVCWLRATTGKMLQGRLVDTMIAASVIDETRFKYSLDSLSKDYLNEAKYKYDLQEKVLEWSKGMIKDPMSNMHRIPGALAKDYAKQDVDLTLKLWNLFDKKLDEVLYTKTHDDGKVEEKTCRKIFELETKLFRCLVDMKFKGVRIDVPKIKKFGAHLTKRKTQILQAIENQTGIKIDIWAASSIKNLLDQQNITDYKKTPKSGMPQLPKDYLKTHKNKCLRMIAKAREYDKAINTFITGLLSYVHEGRIHADVNQIRSDQGGTVTGRFSMSNPNLQQIPSKGYIGKKMREMFLPEEGCKWGSFDYSQQEPRIVVHYAVKLGLPKTEDLEQEFNKNDADFHQIVADMAKISRTQAKTINLGLFYGMGKLKLQAELGLDKMQLKNYLMNIITKYLLLECYLKV
jgi:DNA polymerase-1